MRGQTPTWTIAGCETRGTFRADAIYSHHRVCETTAQAEAGGLAAGMCSLGCRPGTPEFEQAVKAFIRRSLETESREFVVTEGGRDRRYTVIRHACGMLTYADGLLWEFKFRVIDDAWEWYTALVHAPLNAELLPQFPVPQELLIRVDSGCETGQLYGEKTCECKDQLQTAIQYIFAIGQGLIVNIPTQDGRGHGIGRKLATLTAQQLLGLDTVEAARLVNIDRPIDVRTYGGAVAVLRFLGVEPGTKLLPMTNNPEKLDALTANGFEVAPVSLVIPSTEFTRRHLQAKAKCLGHHALLEKNAV